MPVGYTEKPEEKRLESMEYLSIAIPKLFKTPLFKYHIIKPMGNYYSELHMVNKAIEDGVFTGIEYRKRLKNLKETYTEKIAKELIKRNIIFDREFREEQWQFSFHLVEEYIEKHNLVFKKTEWEISLAPKDVKRFIKAMEKLKKHSLKTKESDDNVTITISIKQLTE